MSKYVNASGLRKPDWLWATLKKNPEGLLFLAAGCALLLRRGRSIERIEQVGSDAQEYLGQHESIPDDIPHQNRVGEWAKEASRIAENARDRAASLSKKMSETAGEYAGAASEYARDTREKVVDQSRRLAEKGQAGFPNPDAGTAFGCRFGWVGGWSRSGSRSSDDDTGAAGSWPG